MGILKKLKPKQVKITANNTTAAQIEYYCKTSVVTKMLLERQGKAFNEQLAKDMETPLAVYFVVKKDATYAPVTEPVLRDILGLKTYPLEEREDIPELPETDKPKRCKDHYIKSLL